MTYYFVEPEVPGHKGRGTIIADRTVHPMIISKLQYEFDALPEDALITSFPVYLLRRDAKMDLAAMQPSGVAFDRVQLSKSDEFRFFSPNRKLPEFVWLRITGKPGHDDFGITPAPDLRLVISQKVLMLLVKLGISHATIEDYPLAGPDHGYRVPGDWQPKYPVNPETGQTMKVHEVVSIKGKKYIVNACDYTTGEPQFLEVR